MPHPGIPAGVLRDFPDHAIRWLLESNANVRGLLLAAAPDLAARIDCDRLVHLPTSFVVDTLRAREADCVLRGPYRPADGSPEREVWLYILLEHQSDPDPWMPFRLLSYMLALWESERRAQEEQKLAVGDRRLTPILPVVLYTGSRPWDRLGTLADLADAPPELCAYLPRHDSVFFSVTACERSALTASGDPLGWVLLLFRLSEAPVQELAATLREVFSRLEALARAGDAEVPRPRTAASRRPVQVTQVRRAADRGRSAPVLLAGGGRAFLLRPMARGQAYETRGSAVSRCAKMHATTRRSVTA